MHFIWLSAVKDLRRLRREPTTLLIWLGIPTFIALLLTVVFGRGETRPHGKLLIADEDGGLAATVFTGAFTQGPLGEMISVERVKRDDGRKRIDQGDGSAFLIIPAGFTTAVMSSQPVTLQLIRNPAQRILPDIIEETIAILSDGAFYLQAVAGAQLQAASGAQAPTDMAVAQIAVQINRIVTSLQKYLRPPLIQLDNKVAQDEMERPGAFAALLFPSMLYMAVFFIAGGLATDVWRERTSGALRRIATTPVTLAAFIAGKFLAAGIVLFAVGLLGLTLGHLLISLPVANFPLASLWIAASGSGLYLFMMLLQSLASTERVANLLTNFVTLPLAMLGGSFFPFESMPAGMARIGRLTPNGWSLSELRSILSGSPELSAFLAAAVFVAVAWWLAVLRIRRTPC
jgi:ABC-type multidrug transport system permease subunit